MDYKIFVPDMQCERCVQRIKTALQEAQINFSVSLEDKEVSISGCEHCLKTVVESLEDLGFTPNIK